MRRVHRGDTAAGVVILLALLAIAAWVGWRGLHAPPRQGPEGSLKDVFDPPGELAGLRLKRLRYFTLSDLHEYINGQAPRYFQFGFKALTVAEYVSPKGRDLSLVVDLYNMGARHNAYGIWKDGRGEDDASLQAGNAAYAAGNMAAFWKGGYFVRLRALTDDDLAQLVRKAAVEAAAWIEDGLGQMEEFAAFPRDGLLDGGLTYENEAAFGLPHLNAVFVAEYDLKNARFRLFHADAGAPEKALDVLRAHERFLAAGGTVEERRLEGPDPLIWGREKYTGPSLLLARGSVLAGCLGLNDRAQAETLVKDLHARLKTLPKAPLRTAPHGGDRTMTYDGQQTTDD